MNKPDIKIMAVSNVFSRVMHFKKAGDIEQGHLHTYDHATLISSGSVRVDILSDALANENSREFVAPAMVFIRKDKIHRLTALEDNTVCVCIHALRTVDEEIVDAEFLMEEVVGGNNEVKNLVAKKCSQPMSSFISP
jgi:hypothetical protein